MKLITQDVKSIMENCKQKAIEAGLFPNDTGLFESLEYIVTNRDMTDLGPKNMIPTLYDYWVQDVQVMKERGKYELYPNNAYETVINTRPGISFYNDNNPDWLNTMIFYHVLGHIDFFRNNIFFSLTWDDDFCEQAATDKRTIQRIREECGADKRWVDYVIEFTRGLDNLVGYYEELSESYKNKRPGNSDRVEYFFGTFLLDNVGASRKESIDLIERLNGFIRQFGEKSGEDIFFEDIIKKYPEFAKIYSKHKINKKSKPKDLIEYIIEHSPYVNKPGNEWVKTVMQIVRKTSLYFAPQIRTKILNEGWASYWHQRLFEQDSAMSSHEINYSCVNAKVLSVPRVGINPYAVGCLLLEFIEELADKGKLGHEFEKIDDSDLRKSFDAKTGKGRDFLFYIRSNFNDFMFINFLSEKNFQDFTEKNKLFVVGKRINSERRTFEYFVKSRKGEDYRRMLIDSLYHPPCIYPDDAITQKSGILYLEHEFEGKPLYRKYIENTMIGIERLWGNPVRLETTELVTEKSLGLGPIKNFSKLGNKEELGLCTIVYTMDDGVLGREEVSNGNN